ncbi:unnamed protein product [Boreogadus saida]
MHRDKPGATLRTTTGLVERAPDPPLLPHNQSSSHGGTVYTLRIPDKGFELFVTFTFTEVTNDTKNHPWTSWQGSVEGQFLLSSADHRSPVVHSEDESPTGPLGGRVSYGTTGVLWSKRRTSLLRVPSESCGPRGGRVSYGSPRRTSLLRDHRSPVVHSEDESPTGPLGGRVSYGSTRRTSLLRVHSEDESPTGPLGGRVSYGSTRRTSLLRAANTRPQV